MIKSLLISTFFVLGSGCVTVNLGKDPNGKRAQGIVYKDPTAPFVKDEATDVDAAWKNPRNGNVISFLSDCKDPSDPALEHIVQGALSGLAELQIESVDNPTVQGREARRVLASGKVDGVPSRIDLLTFKRNTCIYIVGYVGVKSAFLANRPDFETFLRNFHAP